MLAVPVFDVSGKRVGDVEVDPALLGGTVRPALLKQAVVTHQDRWRQRSARTKGRSDTEGSTRKLYRQKGTGHARAGTIRTPVRRGGGRAFAKRVPGAVKVLSKGMRRLARNNAILAKIQAEDAMIVQDLRCAEPRTKTITAVLAALGVAKSSLLATAEHDRNVHLSCRNIPDMDVRPVAELNAYDVLHRRKLIFTRPAFERLLEGLTGGDAKATGK